MQLTELPPIPTAFLERLTAIDGATLQDIAEAAYERGFTDGVKYKTVRAQEAARKKDAAIAFGESARIIAGAIKVRSDLERQWYKAMCNTWGAVDYEPETFWVTVNGQNRKYTPDWRVTAPDGRVVYLETKPMPWVNAKKNNPHAHSYHKQAVTMQAVVQRHQITLYVLSGLPDLYDVFQPLGLDYQMPFSTLTLARLGVAHKAIPKSVLWTTQTIPKHPA